MEKSKEAVQSAANTHSALKTMQEKFELDVVESRELPLIKNDANPGGLNELRHYFDHSNEEFYRTLMEMFGDIRESIDLSIAHYSDTHGVRESLAKASKRAETRIGQFAAALDRYSAKAPKAKSEEELAEMKEKLWGELDEINAGFRRDRNEVYKEIWSIINPPEPGLGPSITH
ncbi:MAG: hypothetical protein LVQ95_04210 [Candidatus Micrarchaeales archaeon]|nr:hypothetical protein [Candidatus Micrarchaeales archaeon]